MRKNLGNVDRIVRSLFAIVVSLLYINQIIAGVLADVLMVISGLLLITSLLRFCPSYITLRINTCKQNQQEK